MFKKISIIMLAIVLFVSFNSVAFAKNNKTKAGSGINPAGKSDKPGFDNGNAWWKNNQCVDVVDSLEADVDALNADIEFLQEDNDALVAENESLRAQIEELIAKAAEQKKMQVMNAQRSMQVETKQVRLQVLSPEHGAGNQACFYYIAYSQDESMKDRIRNLLAGQYRIDLTVTQPDGETIEINSDFEGYHENANLREVSIRNIVQ